MLALRKVSHYLALFFILLILSGCESKSIHSETAIKQQKALLLAQKELPNHGILEQSHDGYVYLKVPDEYVYRLFPLIKEPGFIKPDSIRRHTKIGAHVTVFYANEGKEIKPIEELGKTYTFIPQDILTVRSAKKEFIVLVIDSPELEQLRKNHDFSPWVQGHAFHITLAERRLR